MHTFYIFLGQLVEFYLCFWFPLRLNQARAILGLIGAITGYFWGADETAVYSLCEANMSPAWATCAAAMENKMREIEEEFDRIQ